MVFGFNLLDWELDGFPKKRIRSCQDATGLGGAFFGVEGTGPGGHIILPSPIFGSIGISGFMGRLVCSNGGGASCRVFCTTLRAMGTGVSGRRGDTLRV